MKKELERKAVLPKDWYKRDIGNFTAYEKVSGRAVEMKRGLWHYYSLEPKTGKRCKISKNEAEQYEAWGKFLIPILTKDDLTGTGLVFKALFRQKWDVLYYLIMTLFASLLGMAVPASIGIITDRVLLTENQQEILILGFSILLAVLASILIYIVVNRTQIRVQTRSEYMIFGNIFSRVLQMRPNEQRAISEHLTGTFQSFLIGIEQFIGNFFSVLSYSIMCVFLLPMMFFSGSSQESYGYICLLILLNVLIFFILIWRTKKIKVREREKRSDYFNFNKELLDNIEVIRSCKAEEHFKDRYRNFYCRYMDERLHSENNQQWLSVILTMLNSIGIWLLFVLSSSQHIADSSQIAVSVSMYSLLMSYLSMLMSSAFSLITGCNSLELASEIMAKPIELYDEEGEQPEIEGNISIRNVSFTYENQLKPVLDDFSLEISHGEYIGVVGASGCGKSTLLRLLLGFEAPDSGEILFDGINLKNCNVQTLRKQYGVVLQNSSLISGSIAANIGLSEYPDMQRVYEVAKLANIYDDIMTMPMKFNTIVSADSMLVSGGQCQRIVLARALMYRPKILFLDEATSAMDNLTQKVVKENLDKLKITRIALAHRISTVQDCDRIILLEHGKIVEEGTYEELIRQDGIFAKMARRNL